MWSKLDSTQVLYYIEDEGFNCRRIRALETQKAGRQRVMGGVVCR